MPTLNTLRTKGGVIVSIVIGVSLIAFLLGDLTAPGSRILGERKMRVGEIAGTKIGYTEYGQEADYMTRIAQVMSGTDNLSAEQTDQARNMAWESLILKYAYAPGFEKLGIAPGAGEQADMVSGIYLSPVIAGLFVNQSTGLFDGEMLRQFVANIDADATGNSAMMWEYLKEQMLTQRNMSKYITLINKGMFVNDLEAGRGAEASNNVYSIRYVAQNYASIPDSAINVTNAQIKEYYSKHKDMFHQTEGRILEYVLFDMAPSEDDMVAAAERIEGMAREFTQAENPMQYATANSTTSPDARYVSLSSLDPALAAVISGKDRTAIYGPMLNGQDYVMSRYADSRMMPDTIGAQHILLDPAQTAKADSLVAVIKNGGDFAALATQYSLDQQTPGGDFGRFTPESMLPEISDACVKASKGDVFVVKTNYGLHIVKLTYKTNPVLKYQVATVTYRLDPSPATEQNVYGKASAFLSSAAGSPEKFDAAVAASDLSKRTVRVSNTDRIVNGLENSREMVRWAFNAENGAVSAIMEINGDYVVAKLAGVRHEGIASLEEATLDIRMILVREQKAKLLATKMQGGSLDAVAASLGVDVATAEGIQQSAFFIEGLGVEMQLIGAIGAVPQGKVSKPVEGSNGVYMFEVTFMQKDENVTLDAERVRLAAMAQSYINERVNMALMAQSKIKDMRVKFF